MLRTLATGGFLVASLLGAQDWPRFRGPNGSGTAQVSNLPVEFGAERNLAWKVDVPAGHSSPVVFGRSIYITGFEDASLTTMALDRETGQKLWSQTIARQREGKLNGLNTPASPTPVADEKGVVVFFQDFGLVAYTKKGTRQWQVPLESRANAHGMSSSPIVVGGLVVQLVASDTGSVLLAVDRKSGQKRWESPLLGVTYATPVVVERPGKAALIVALSTGEAIAVDASNGQRIWWLRGVPYQPKASPIVSPDGSTVFLAVLTVGEGTVKSMADFDKLLQAWDVNGDGQVTQAEIRERKGPAGAFVQIDVNGDGFFTRQEHHDLMQIAVLPNMMGALPADSAGDATERMRWVYRKSVPNVPSPLLYDGLFYAIKEGGIATAFNAETGAVSKEGRIAAGFGEMYSSPVAGDGKIYAISRTGKIAVLKAGVDWEPMAVSELGEECFATPALSRDSILVRTTGHLWCFRNAGSTPRK